MSVVTQPPGTRAGTYLYRIHDMLQLFGESDELNVRQLARSVGLGEAPDYLPTILGTCHIVELLYNNLPFSYGCQRLFHS